MLALTADHSSSAMPLRYTLGSCALPMVLGGAIYLLFRDTGMLMFHWVDTLGLSAPLTSARAWAAPARSSLPTWLLYSVPDGAWVYSCTAFFAGLWPDGPALQRWGWISVGAVLAIGGELGQAAGLVPGTFDPADVIACALAATLAVLLRPR